MIKELNSSLVYKNKFLRMTSALVNHTSITIQP